MNGQSILGLSSALIFLLVGACDCGGDVLDRIVPKIVIEDRSIDFGEVTVGGTKRVSLTIRNAGSDDLDISAIDTTTPFFVETLSVTIPPGDEYLLDVGFTPAVQDPVMGSLLIVSNSPEEEMIKVNLKGQGVIGYLRIEPAELDFGTVPVGAERGLEFVVSNSALEPFTGFVSTEGFIRPEHFELSGVAAFAAGGNYSVGARSQGPYTVSYRPQFSGKDNGRIVFETCGERCGLEVKILAASGEAAVRFEPSQIDFGSVGIGVARSESLTIMNDGSESLEIYDISVPGNAFSTPQLSTLPILVEPKNRFVMTVQFEPSQAQEFTSEVIIRTSDPTLRQGRVALIGIGEGPLFSVEPPNIDFGVEREIASYRRTFLLSNEGSTPVNVLEVTLTGDSTYGLANLPGLPATLSSGETIVGQVVYEPVLEEISSATLTVKTDDSVNPELEVSVTGRHALAACELEIVPARANFGIVPVGFGRRKSVSVTNSGMAACTLLSGDFIQPVDPFFAVRSLQFPVTLAPGQTQDILFTYLPTNPRDAKVNFALQTDDMQFPERLINLVASSLPSSEIFVLPTNLDFGRQRPGCGAVQRVVTVYNAGTAPETIDRLSLSSTTSEYVAPNVNLPVSLPAGQSVSFTINYQTQDFGEDYADVEIGLVGQSFSFVVPMTGRGDPDPQVREVFTQVENSKVDVLFVIDDSCSMVQEQMDLAQNFNSFINTANRRNVDFNIGVTTTDIVNYDGTLVGPVVRSTTPNFAAVFENQAVRGTQGSGIEMGLEGMYRAIERARAGSSHNRDLLRTDADFVGVIVTDEDDQSPASGIFYLQYLRQQFGNRFQVAAISGGSGGCGPRAAPSPRLESFMTLANGSTESICSGNWANSLSTLGAIAFGLRERYRLNQAADTSRAIEVKVNGLVVSASDWSYDITTEEIVFGAMSVPPENATIEVTYVPRC